MFRFGVVELDAQTGELRKNGFLFRLQKQPLQLLLLLLERPGHVVTRDELRRALWPETVVDFDGGLHSAVKRLRDALADSAARPRYVETVGRLGYRFIAALEPVVTEPVESIAVLPFQNLTGNRTHDIAAAAITEAVARHLSQATALRVVSQGSMSRDTILREPKLEAVVEGTLESPGPQLHVMARWLHAAADSRLWTRRYEFDATNAALGPSAVARTITEEIHAVLKPWNRAAVMTRRPPDPRAQEAYLRGRSYLTPQTSMACVRALGHFYEAVAREPRFALAYAGLSDCYRLLSFVGPWSPRACMPRAEFFARKALLLDESLVEAYASLAAIAYRFRHDWAEGERQFQRALSVDPKHAETRWMYSVYLLAAGRIDEGITEAHRAYELDPTSSEIWEAWPLFWTRQYDAAIVAFERACAMNHMSAVAHLGLGSALAMRGGSLESIPALTTAVKLSRRTLYLARLGHAYAVVGKETEARAILAELRKRARRRYVSPVGMALIQLGLGDASGALSLLENAYEVRDFDLVTRNPRLDALVSEPRFEQLMRRVRPACEPHQNDPHRSRA